MNKFIFALCLMTIAFSCTNSHKFITIALENGSDVRPTIDVSTYVNGNLVDSRKAERDTVKTKYTIFKTELVKQNSVIQFKIPNSDDTISRTIALDSVTDHSVIRVYLIETLFKKGWRYNTTTLDKDSIVRKDFNCEVLYHGGKFID